MSQDISNLRANPYGAVRAMNQAERHNEHRLLPIATWQGREYVVIDAPKLTAEMQRVTVIDLTELDAVTNAAPGIAERIRPVRVNAVQPTMEHDPQVWMEEGETVESFLQRTRRHVVVVFPDEGHTSILENSGNWRWVSLADLPIRMIPGTSDDYREVHSQQMDELEQSVDAGGHLDL